jgi:ABC-type antimicrobial peptide transport system permease subunit
MGIRLALGATRSQIVSLVLRQGIFLVGAGCIVGLAIAAMAGRLLRSFLFATSPLDPVAFALVPILLMILAVVAAWEPARRAASIQPMESLRSE